MNSENFIIHIGRHKTGSTALQLFLNRNRDALLSNGFFFPSPLELHADLAVQFMYEQGTELPPDVAHRFPWIGGKDEAPYDNVKKQIAEKENTTVILSCEGFCNVNPEVVAKYFPIQRTKVIVYIREQLDYMLSAYAQAIQETKRTYSFSEFEQNEFLDYLVFLNQWRNCFSDNLEVRIYERDCLIGGEIRSDFLEVLNIAERAKFIFPNIHANPSIGGPLLQFKLLLNQHSPWPVEKLMPATYRNLGNLAAGNERYRSKIFIPDNYVQSIRDKYAVLNENVLARFFLGSDRKALFSNATQLTSEQENALEMSDFEDIMSHFQRTEPAFFDDHYSLLKNAFQHKEQSATSRVSLSEHAMPLPVPNSILEKCKSPIRAVYYYGSACPMSFWDTFRREEIDKYFLKIKQDGFNSVIFIIPIALIDLKRKTSPLYDKFLIDFNFLIRKCNQYGLLYLLRLFYVWDSYPVVLDRLCLTYQIYSKQYLPDYEAVLAELAEKVENDSLFLFGFTTWEDLLPQLITAIPKASPQKRSEIAALLEFPPDVTCGGGVPQMDSPKYASYLIYLDERFADLMKKLALSFPKLTTEARVDVTPIPQPDGTFVFHFHDRQFTIGEDLGVIGTYYAPYMGASNLGDEIDSEVAFRNFEISQQKAKTISGVRVFVDQLLLRIGQDKFKHFSKMNSIETEKFVFERLAIWLSKFSVGYATWSFQDYILSAVSNAAFQLPGLAGWSPSGDVRQVRQGAISMTGKSNLRQKRLTRRVDKAFVRLDFEVIDDAEITVELGDGRSFSLNYAGKWAENVVFQQITHAPATELSLSITSGSCIIRKCLLGWDFHSNGGYGLDFSKGEVSDVWKRLNAVLAKVGYIDKIT
jgi:hypothetical protein